MERMLAVDTDFIRLHSRVNLSEYGLFYLAQEYRPMKCDESRYQPFARIALRGRCD